MLARILGAVLAGGTILLALSAPEEPRQGAVREGGAAAVTPRISIKEGPRLRGVYGRKAASVRDFGYSEALKKANIRWDDASLERWLSDPDAMVPDTDMAFSIADGEERKAVIAYLKSLGNQ